MDKLDRIGILGGSFDPIHLGHLNMGLRALEDFNLDRVFYITAKNSPFKVNKNFSDAQKRHELVESTLADHTGLEASRIELDREEEVSYTYQTIEEYKKLYPDSELFLLLGEDVFSRFNQWKSYDWIMQNIRPIVFSRGNSSFTATGVDYVEDFDFPISSTELRKQGLSSSAT